MSTQREIGDGWVESVDVASGRKYYANTITQVCVPKLALYDLMTHNCL